MAKHIKDKSLDIYIYSCIIAYMSHRVMVCEFHYLSNTYSKLVSSEGSCNTLLSNIVSC